VSGNNGGFISIGFGKPVNIFCERHAYIFNVRFQYLLALYLKCLTSSNSAFFFDKIFLILYSPRVSYYLQVSSSESYDLCGTPGIGFARVSHEVFEILNQSFVKMYETLLK